jgi:hypothetical protein
LREIFIAKGYLIDPPLQTTLAGESSIVAQIFDGQLWQPRPDYVQPLLTMNSVARHTVTD